MSKDEEGKKDKNRKLRQKKIAGKKVKARKENLLKLKQAANPGNCFFLLLVGKVVVKI
jgi:hypothetical protein